MRNLPAAAKAYLIATLIAGTAAMILSQVLNFPASNAKSWEVLVFIALGAAAGGQKVTISKHLANEEAGSMSLGFAITFASLLNFGPGPAVVVGVAGGLSSCLIPKRQPFHQLSFNVALGAAEAFLGSLVFVALNGLSLHMRWPDSIMAVTVSALTFYAVNTVGVATIIGLCSSERLHKIWRENFLWTAPSYFASASICAFAMFAFKANVTAVVLCVAPIAFLVHQSYVVYTSRADEQRRHAAEMEVSQAHLAELYLQTIKSLALAIDAKDQYTHQHILRVQRYSVAIAEQMGLTGSELEAVNTGALLHDIGKLGVPEYVLMKPGRLTAEEFEKIKKHPEIGAAILDPVEFPWPVLPVVRHHHEKWDGTGYPDGLAGENIPLTARIMAVADVYDALTSSRSYRRAWTHEKAVATIKKDAGTHFDPVVVDAFLEVIDSVVQEMASLGEGPLAVSKPDKDSVPDKAHEAAREISKTSRELFALYEVSDMLSAGLGSKDTLDIFARKVAAIFPGTLCAYLIPDLATGGLQVSAQCGVNAEFFSKARTISQTSLSLRVGEGQAPISCEYDPDDLMLTASESAQWVELRSCVIVPVSYKGESAGTLNVYHPEAEAFSEHDVHILTLIAERSAEAIYNGLMLDRTDTCDGRDELTGALTAAAFAEVVDIQCAESIDTVESARDRFALLCLDLNSFRAVNENFGHKRGDAILKAVARIIEKVSGKSTVFARYGGDEFVIWMQGGDHREAQRLAGQLEQAIDAYDAHLSHEELGDIRISINCGIACFPFDGADCATLLSVADADLHRQKSMRKLKSLIRHRARRAA